MQASAATLSDEGFQRAAREHGYELRIRELPLSGSVTNERVPWADTNWPELRGMIGWRWNDPAFAEVTVTEEGLPYRPPTENAVRAMSRDQLARLSPAEKYDIFMGHFRYPTVTSLMEEPPDLESPWWAGICGGWSSAALQYPEPAARDVVGPSGISVPFGSSDIKALLAYYHEAGYLPGELGVEEGFDVGEVFEEVGEHKRKTTLQIGAGCEGDECEHPTAAELHITMANELGRKQSGFVVDVRADERTYYQPAFAYESRIVAERDVEHAGRPARELHFATTLKSASDMNDIHLDVAEGTSPRWEPRIAKGENVVLAHAYEYVIVVAKDTSAVLSSKWLSADRPDAIFMRTVQPGFKGHLRGLAHIVGP